MATGTLFLYFPGKEELLVHLFREDLEPVLEAAFATVDHGAPLLDQLVLVFDRVRERLEEDRELAAVFLKQLVFLTEDTRPEIVAFTGSFVRSIAELVEQAQETGERPTGLPTLPRRHQPLRHPAHQDRRRALQIRRSAP